MAQHDHDIANASGAAVRADLNALAAAQVSLNSGATAPSPSFAGQWWHDTSTSTLKRRNAANTTWITIGPIDEALIAATEAVKGIAEIATQAEADAVLDDVRFVTAAKLGAFAGWKGYIAGLTLSNNGGDANNDIDIAAGVACADNANVLMILTSALTKRLDAAWAVGTNQGGLDTGSEASSTWYHLHLIRRPDTGVVDVLFSLSATAPTMPANYTQRRRIGAVFNNGSSNLVAFKQFGDIFLLSTAVGDVNTAVLSTTATLYTLGSVPTGVNVEALARMAVSHASGCVVLVTSPDESDRAPNAIAGDYTMANTAGAGVIAMTARIMTNTSAQIRARSNATNTTFVVATYGWIDTRGRFN